MRVWLSDPSYLPELLTFLREEGCVAYSESRDEVIEAIVPHAFGHAEVARIERLLERWHEQHPEVRAAVLEG